MQKEHIQQMLNQLPDSVDVDEFVEKLYLLRKIELGEQQLHPKRNHRTLTQKQKEKGRPSPLFSRSLAAPVFFVPSMFDSLEVKVLFTS